MDRTGLCAALDYTYTDADGTTTFRDDVGPCPSQPWLTLTNFICQYFGDCGQQTPPAGPAGSPTGGSGLGGGGGQVPPKTGPTITAAPPTPWYKNPCIASALGDAALHLGIDAIGLIPEAEGFTKVFENAAGYQIARVVGNSAGYRGVVATQYGMRVVAQGKGAVGAISGAFGLGDTSAEGRISTGLTIAGFIPGVGTAAAAGSIGVDVYKTVKTVSQCA